MLRLKETPERCSISQCQMFPLCCRKGYDVPGIDESYKKINQVEEANNRTHIKWPLDQVLKRPRIDERRTVLEGRS